MVLCLTQLKQGDTLYLYFVLPWGTDDGYSNVRYKKVNEVRLLVIVVSKENYRLDPNVLDDSLVF